MSLHPLACAIIFLPVCWIIFKILFQHLFTLSLMILLCVILYNTFMSTTTNQDRFLPSPTHFSFSSYSNTSPYIIQRHSSPFPSLPPSPHQGTPSIRPIAKFILIPHPKVLSSSRLPFSRARVPLFPFYSLATFVISIISHHHQNPFLLFRRSTQSSK